MSFFDLRRPLGWLFSTLGILLVIAGLRATPAADARSLGININLIWGVVMIAFASPLSVAGPSRSSPADAGRWLISKIIRPVSV